MGLVSWESDKSYAWIYSSILSVGFYTFEGDSVNFEVTGGSDLSETVNFIASNGSDSIAGTIVVQLPVQ